MILDKIGWEVEKVSKLEVPEIPPEIAYEQLLISFKDCIATFMQALTDKFGSEEALKFIRPYLVKMGKEMTEVSAPMLGIEGKDAIAIGTLIRVFEERILKVKGKVTEASPDKVVAVNTACIFQDCKPEACLIFQHITDGTIQVINPAYRYRMTKLIPKGDKECEWVLEKKK
jgi:hypothetical protein